MTRGSSAPSGTRPSTMSNHSRVSGSISLAGLTNGLSATQVTWTLVVLYVVTQLIAGLIMSSSAAGSQRWITLGLPLVFAPIIIGFPAGVVLYWITSNVWTMGQQAVIKIFFPAQTGGTPKPEVVAGEGGAATAAAAIPTKAPPPPPRKKKRRR